MTVYGDMAAFVSVKFPDIDMPEAQAIIAAALEAADDPNFAIAFQREVETASGFLDYMDVIKFLRKVNR